jgi:hypothetical protein
MLLRILTEKRGKIMKIKVDKETDALFRLNDF